MQFICTLKLFSYIVYINALISMHYVCFSAAFLQCNNSKVLWLMLLGKDIATSAHINCSQLSLIAASWESQEVVAVPPKKGGKTRMDVMCLSCCSLGIWERCLKTVKLFCCFPFYSAERSGILWQQSSWELRGAKAKELLTFAFC